VGECKDLTLTISVVLTVHSPAFFGVIEAYAAMFITWGMQPLDFTAILEGAVRIQGWSIGGGHSQRDVVLMSISRFSMKV
jgi:hypothetical protein